MATRATITVTDEHDSFDIYQHYDGYPDGEHGVVRHIAMARQLAWSPPRFEAADFAAAIVAVFKNRGGSTYLTKDASAHTDRAFHYQIEQIRDDVSTRVQLTITRPSWRSEDADIEMFKGSIQDAVQKFNATPDTTDQPREWQTLDEVDATLNRATEEICQWFKGTPNEDTQNTLDDIEDANCNLMRLRHHLEKADPWNVLGRIETILSNVDDTNVTRTLGSVKVEAKLAMEAHRRFQRN
jgi:hypothetical protein